MTIATGHHLEPLTFEDLSQTDRRLSTIEFLLPVVLGVLLVLVPTLIFFVPATQYGSFFTLGSVIFVVCLIYSVTRIVLQMWATIAQPSWMTVGFWVFCYSFLAVAGLTQSVAGANPLSVTLSTDEVSRQGLLLLVGMIAFDAANSWARNKYVATSAFGPQGTRALLLSKTRVYTLATISVAATPVFIIPLGGVEALFSSREAIYDQLADSGLYSSASNAAGGLISTMANCIPFVALICLLRLRQVDVSARKGFAPTTLLILTITSNVLLNNPISNSRYWAFTVLLGLFYLASFSAKRLVATTFIFVFSMSTLVLFPYLDAFRYESSTVQAYQIQTNNYDRPIDYLLNKTDYGSITDIGIVMRIADDQGLTFGRQFLGVLSFWVPRSIWEDKPDNTAFIIADSIGFENRNLDSPLWAEGFIDFAWPGAVLLLGASGFAAGTLDRRYAEWIRVRRRIGRAPSATMLSVLVPSLAGYEFILLRGSLLQAMSRLSVLIVLILLVSIRPAEDSVGGRT